MKKIQRALGILIALSLVLAMIPAAAFASDTHKVAIHWQQYGMGIADEQGVRSNQYYLVDPDGKLKSEGADASNYNIYYDESTNHLTIHNLQISSENMLLVPGGVTLEVLGENRIALGENGSTGGGIGVVSDGDLTITGNGSLYLSSSSHSGIGWTAQNNAHEGKRAAGGVQIKGGVALTIEHFGATTCIDTHEGDVVIGEDAVVTLDPRKGNDNTFSIAFFNGESITVQDRAQVYSTASIDTLGKNAAGNYGMINLLGSSVLTFEVADAEIGRAMHASGGVYIREDVKVAVSSNTLNGQVIASSAGDVTIAGEVEVNMLNQSSVSSAAVYGQNIFVTGKLTVNGGVYAMYIPEGNKVELNGADVKVMGAAVGVMQKAQVTNSLIEMDTTMRAFGTAPDVSLTNEYEVYAGKAPNDAVFIPHTNGAAAPETWISPYVRIGSHTCTYDQQVISDEYLASAADCESPETYYYSCVCGAKGEETFENGTAAGHDWGEPVWSWAEDGKSAAVTFTCNNDSTHTQSPEVLISGLNGTSPTCTDWGTMVYNAKASLDGKEYRDVKIVKDTSPLGHQMTKTDKVEATCTTAGKEAYYTCQRCGKHFSDETGEKEISNLEEYGVLPAIEHKAGTEWKHDETGHWNECMNNCGEKLNEAAHTFEWVTDKEATATQTGMKHEKCTVCGYEKAAVEIPATGSNTPQTGDGSHLTVWLMLAFVSGGAALALSIRRKKKGSVN